MPSSHLLSCLVVLAAVLGLAQAFGSCVSARPFGVRKGKDESPKLILISGAPGTGKSTFGMSVALDQNILKCISTDTVRAVMRSFVSHEISPSLHRSSYAPAGEGDDPVKSWLKTCAVLGTSIEGIVNDSISRGQCLVLEGVHLVPSTKLVERWEKKGGVAIGVLLTIKDSDAHKDQLRRRGIMTGKEAPEQRKIRAFHRIRAIQDDMIRRAEKSNWLMVEQRLEPDPLDMVEMKLWDPSYASVATEKAYSESQTEMESNDERPPNHESKKSFVSEPKTISENLKLVSELTREEPSTESRIETEDKDENLPSYEPEKTPVTAPLPSLEVSELTTEERSTESQNMVENKDENTPVTEPMPSVVVSEATTEEHSSASQIMLEDKDEDGPNYESKTSLESEPKPNVEVSELTTEKPSSESPGHADNKDVHPQKYLSKKQLALNDWPLKERYTSDE